MTSMANGQKRILIVDDDEAIRNSLARILRRTAHEILLAKDGNDALELVVSGYKPDLLIIDIRMPGMDGIEAFQKLRQHCPSLIAIFMTAYSSSKKTLEAQQRGALSILAKPLDISRLLNLVTSALSVSPVLVADDDAQLVKSIGRALRAHDIDVETANSLQSAALMLRQRPDRVVIADVFLGDGYGYELLRSDMDQGSQAPFILMTGQTDWIDSELAKSLPRKITCLAKPLNMEQLLEQVTHS